MFLTAVPVISIAHGPLRRSNTLTPEIIKPLKDFASAKAEGTWKTPFLQLHTQLLCSISYTTSKCNDIFEKAWTFSWDLYILIIWLIPSTDLTRVKVHPLGSLVMTSTFERCLSLYILAGWMNKEFENIMSHHEVQGICWDCMPQIGNRRLPQGHLHLNTSLLEEMLSSAGPLI